jgi:hypothetical protein
MVNKLKTTINLIKGLNLLFIVLIPIVGISSCDGNCKNEEIEKNEWVTKYVEVSKDTLVNYSIIENKTDYSSYDKEIIHSITIKNENEQFSNQFAVVVTYGHYDIFVEISETKSDTTLYSEILPKSSFTFPLKRQGGYNDNFNAAIEILQIPKYITTIQRIDSLKTEMITVNSCEQNIEALKEKYQTIKKMFESKNPTATENHKDNIVLK